MVSWLYRRILPFLIALIHSPLVGPSVWSLLARELERRAQRVVLPSLTVPANGDWRPMVNAARDALRAADRLTLVGHSNAGLLLPQIARGLNVERFIFVDARVPPASGSAPVADERFLAFLRSLPLTDNRLPPWCEWWGDLAALVFDEATRRALQEDMPRVPFSYVDGEITVPAGWEHDCHYVRFSDPYREEEAEARGRGWRVAVVPGTHLHMLNDPVAVADALT